MAKPRRPTSSNPPKRPHMVPQVGGKAKRVPLGVNRGKTKKKAKEHQNIGEPANQALVPSHMTSAQQLSFFLDQFESANGIRLSSLELEAFKETNMVELPQGMNQDPANLSQHLRATFGSTWKEMLYDGQLSEGKIDAGNPAVLIIGSSAIRCLELLRGLRPLTRECQAVKLFAKHLKVAEQVSFLKSRVNIACGTPSRIKKLIDMEALGLSRLVVVLLDMHTDAKGYSLFTLPQVRNEFWDLYKSHFHNLQLQGDLRICLYGQISVSKVEDAYLAEE